MTKIIQIMCAWIILVLTVTASPMVIFEGTFKDTHSGVLSGQRDVTITLMTGYKSRDNPGQQLWMESIKNVPFYNGFMSVELGGGRPLEAQYFLLPNLRFLVMIEGVQGEVPIPIRHVPYAISSDIARKALQVETINTSQIMGNIQPKQMKGDYFGISRLGPLTQDLEVTEVFRVRQRERKVGIMTTDPQYALSVNGDMGLTGALVFSDGSTIKSAKHLDSLRGPISSDQSVIIQADTEGNKIGQVEVYIGNQKQWVIQERDDNNTVPTLFRQTYVGLGVSNPRQTLEIEGGIRINDTNNNVAGSIRYHDHNFEGYSGTEWNRLDVSSLEGGGWLYDPIKKVSHASITTRFGIGTQEPRGLLEAKGDMFATNYHGVFEGGAQGVIGFRAEAIKEEELSAERGGVGTLIKGAAQLIGVHEGGENMDILPQLKDGGILVGVDNKWPRAANLEGSKGIEVINESGKITIQHGQTSDQKSTTLNISNYIHSGAFDEWGHVQNIEGKEVNERVYSTQEIEDKFIKKEGGTMTNSLRLHSTLMLSGSNSSIKTEGIPIVVDAGVKVGIGVSIPEYPMSVSGAIRIGGSEKKQPGVIRFDTISGRFQGYNNQDWAPLDVTQFDEVGWKLSATGNDVYTIQKNVGIGTYTPTEKLHVKGEMLSEKDIRILGDVIVEEGLELGSNKIEPQKWIGTWDLSDSQLEGLVKLNVENLDVSKINAETMKVHETLTALDGLDFGTMKIKQGHIEGDINFSEGNLTHLNKIEVAEISVTDSTISATNGVVALGPVLEINQELELSEQGITNKKGKEINIQSTKGVNIEGVRFKNKTINNIDHIDIDKKILVSGKSRFEGPVVAKKGAYIEIGRLSVGAETKENEVLSVSGDMVIGKVSNYANINSDKSDLIIAGNLVVKGSFIEDERDMETLNVSGLTRLSTRGEQLVVGNATDQISNAKMVIVGDGADHNSVTTQWYNNADKNLLTILNNGYVGFGEIENPLALLHVGAGSQERAAIKIKKQTLTNTPQKGALEYDGNDYYLTTALLKRVKMVGLNSTQNIHNKRFEAPKLSNMTIQGTLELDDSEVNIQTNMGKNLIMEVGGNVGINIPQPKAQLSVNGGVRIGFDSAGVNSGGEIRYKDDNFEGYIGNESRWVVLDYGNMDSPWRTGNGGIYTNKKVGIGVENSQYEMEVAGTVSSNYLIGEGSQLTHLNESNMGVIIPVNKGGTGKGGFEIVSLLLGNNDNTLQEASMIGNGKLIIGSTEGEPKANNLIADEGIKIVNEPGNITISHLDNSDITNQVFENGNVIKKIERDSSGHLTKIESKNLDQQYFSIDLGNQTFLARKGGTLTGPLIFNTEEVALASTVEEPDIHIVAEGNIGIGTFQPLVKLDINGSMRVKSGVGVPGEVQFHNNRFQGYNGANWVFLDIENKVEGVFESTVGFKGGGTQLTELNPNNIEGLVNVDFGGVGVNTLENGGLIIGNGSGGLKTLPILQNGEIIIGGITNGMKVGTIKGEKGVSVNLIEYIVDNRSEKTFEIQSVADKDYNQNLIGNKSFANSEVIGSIKLDNTGRMVNYVTKNLEANDFLLSKTAVGNEYLEKQGGQINGALIFTKNENNISSKQGKDIILMAGSGGGVGMGKTDPNIHVGMDVDGGLKLAEINSLDPSMEVGSIVYSNGVFYGKKSDIDNNGWKKLDIQATMTGTLKADRIQTEDGSGIRKLNIAFDHIQEGDILTVQNGGTGRSRFEQGSVLVGNGSDPVNGIQLAHRTSILMKSHQSNSVTAGILEGDGEGVLVEAEPNKNQITIKHKDTSQVNNLNLRDSEVLSRLDIDKLGHVTYVEVKNLDDYLFNKELQDEKFVKRNGDEMTGVLTFNDPDVDIQTTEENPDFSIIATDLGKVRIGWDIVNREPKSMLELDGAIIVGNKNVENIPGMIYWDNTNKRYKGYDGEKYINLDVQIAETGIVPGGTAISFKETVKVEAPSNGEPAVKTSGEIVAGFFKGGGGLLTDLNPNNISGAVPVSKGGTGFADENYDEIDPETLFVFGGTTKSKYDTVQSEHNKILVGGFYAYPIKVDITSEGGVSHNINDSEINLFLEPQFNEIKRLRNSGEPPKFVKEMTMNNKGIVTHFQTVSQDKWMYTKDTANSLFFNKNGDTMTGALTFNTNNFDIAMKQTTEDLTIQADKVGIGIAAPQTKVHINGAIQLEHQSIESIANPLLGTLIYDKDEGFFGRVIDNGSPLWVKLNQKIGAIDWKGNAAQAYTGNPNQNIIIGHDQAFGSHSPFGIENTRLFVKGAITAQNFVGDGRKISKLDLDALSENAAVKVSNGGTGRASFPKGHILIGNGKDPIKTLELAHNEIVLGDLESENKIITTRSIVGEAPISINMSLNDRIVIKHDSAGLQNNFDSTMRTRVIVSMNVTEYGHVNKVVYGDLLALRETHPNDYDIISENRAGELYLNRLAGEGDLHGPITQQFSSNQHWIMDQNYPLSFDMGAQNIGIGTPSPTEKVTVVGNIKMSTQAPTLFMKDRQGNKILKVRHEYSKKLYFQDHENENIAMLMNLSGQYPQIGIGTTQPSSLVHIKQLADEKAEGIQIESQVNTDPIWNVYSNNNTLKLRPADQQHSVLTDSGQLGIGTNPNATVHIKQTSDNQDGGMRFSPTQSSEYWNGYYNATTTGFVFGYQANAHLTILDDFKVGFGITNPSSALHVKQTVDEAGGGIRLTKEGDSNYWDLYYKATINGLNIERNTNSYLTILKNGNVGIGKTNPNTKLEVNGDMEGTDILFSNGVDVPKLTLKTSSGVDGMFITKSAGFLNDSTGSTYGIKMKGDSTLFQLGWVVGNNKSDFDYEKSFKINSNGQWGIGGLPQGTEALYVKGKMRLSENLNVTGLTTLNTLETTDVTVESLDVNSSIEVNQSLGVNGTTEIRNLDVTNNATLATLKVDQSAELDGTVIMDMITANTGGIDVQNNLKAKSEAIIKSELLVKGTATFEENVTMNTVIHEGATYLGDEWRIEQYLLTAGKVGVQRTNPTVELELDSDDANPEVKISDGNSSNADFNTTLSIDLQDDKGVIKSKSAYGTYRQLLWNYAADSGNVGIGLTNPDKTLHVNGDVKVNILTTQKVEVIDNGSLSNYVLDPDGKTRLQNLEVNEVELSNDSVLSHHIVDGSITNIQIKDDSIKAEDLNVDDLSADTIIAQRLILKDLTGSMPTTKGVFFQENGTPKFSVSNDKSFYLGKGSNLPIIINVDENKIIFLNHGHFSNGIYSHNIEIERSEPTITMKHGAEEGKIYMPNGKGDLNFRMHNGVELEYDGDSNFDKTSDIRLKENIKKEENLLDRINQLKLKKYNFIGDDKTSQIGLIAQDVLPVFPELVSSFYREDKKDHYLFLGYSGLGKYAVGAIKELKNEKDQKILELRQGNEKEFADLNKQLQELKQKNNELKIKMKEISRRINTDLSVAY